MFFNTMFFKTTLLATLIITTSLLTGCYDPVKAPGAGMPDPLSADAYPQIVVTDKISDYMGFHKAVVNVEPGKPMSVVVPARLLKEYAVNAQYRFTFFDKAGNPLEPQMDFQYIRMPARVRVYMKGAALDTTAVEWELTVRSAR